MLSRKNIMIDISASVGKNAKNKKTDVLKIQHAFNGISSDANDCELPKLIEDGLIGVNTKGAILKFQRSNLGLAKDGRIDPKHAAIAFMNFYLGFGFTDKNLYLAGGPSVNDIKQDNLGDCYFVATLSAIAQENASVIRNAIHYDGKRKQFKVNLYNNKGLIQIIWVTQAELQDNIRRGGGSHVDNARKYERTWPTVIETAYVKMNDSNPTNGLRQGYRRVGNGGWPKDAMLALTGNIGTELSFVLYPLLGQTGSIVVLGAKVSVALNQNKVVTLWSVPENDNRTAQQISNGVKIKQDGLVDDHVYTVMLIEQSGLDWKLTVRNPWGTNMGVSEGQDTASARMVLKLSDLVQTGGLNSFRISI